MLKVCILFVLLPFLCNAQRTPSISHITQEQIKDIGGTVELECSVQYAKEYTVLWVKNTRERGDSVFLSTGSSLVIKDSRFALRYDPSSSTYTLQIKDIQETDAGNYQCQVILSVNNKISADVELSVRRPPVISDNSTQSLVVSEGKPVQMECYAGGYPHPTITWRRENNAILPTGEYTKIYILSYHCYFKCSLWLGKKRKKWNTKIKLRCIEILNVKSNIDSAVSHFIEHQTAFRTSFMYENEIIPKGAQRFCSSCNEK